MTCIHCHRANLPGGLRCAYCGTYLPTPLEFDLSAPVTPAEASAPPAATGAPNANAKKAGGLGILTSLGLLALKAKTFLAFLKFGKIFTTLISMFIFIWADAQLFGWKFGAGIAISIFIHEMGHVIVNWRKGLKQSAPVFIPFVGAVIFLKNFPDNPQIQAESGAGGPVAGCLAAVGCLGIYSLTHDPFWLALAHLGFAINLFNLIPFPPLDGSHIHTVFSPGIWNAVLAVLVLWAIKVPSGMLWMIIVVSAIMRFSQPDNGRYLLAPPAVRARMAVLYLALCLGMSYASDHTMTARPRSHINVPFAAQLGMNETEDNTAAKTGPKAYTLDKGASEMREMTPAENAQVKRDLDNAVRKMREKRLAQEANDPIKQTVKWLTTNGLV